ncbi:Spore cortex YabQ family protein [Candidatus Desulfosporosinus infrequens]|uniref:Spore cortex YabQ family protein n=1 Tax=Candidatus Desulfosporosinus infrequens TaxID=2043169 RepID=A0A2U3LQN2_9FIRM|nr:Spore cortex YabQ family protein [Candidatus Desulfosporosinus infrequens]
MGLVFDFYRTFRHWQGLGRALTFVGDVLFSLVALLILFRFFERANALAFRFYIIWGSLLGLVLYLRLISSFSVRCFFGFYRVMKYLADLLCMWVKIPIGGLVLIMRPPYAILLWFSMLIYRIGELILVEPISRIKKSVKEWWNRLLPPKING